LIFSIKNILASCDLAHEDNVSLREEHKAPSDFIYRRQMLGKRKRENLVQVRQSSSTKDGDQQQAGTTVASNDREIFRKHFEAMFEPLPGSESATPTFGQEVDEEDSGPTSDESAWEGLSEPEPDSVPNEETSLVEVVDHRAEVRDTEAPELERQRYKTFMVGCGTVDQLSTKGLTTPQSSRPPRQAQAKKVKPSQSPQEEPDEDGSEALNLKHDLDLQRLLKESHLLERAQESSSPGTHRHKAVDMRMQALGSKDSMFHPDKMPLAHRRGILAKAAVREAGRRKEAKENGIILEKVATKSRSKDDRRQRGVDVPAVGKFRGGTLRLSKRDLLDIQGPGRSGPRGKARRR
jgi:hypothetical protein